MKKIAQSVYGGSCEIDDPKHSIPVRVSVFTLLHTTSRTALGSTQAPGQYVLGFFLGDKVVQT